MQTSTSRNNVIQRNNNYTFLKLLRKNQNEGFSLLEILVALFLVAFITLAVVSGGSFAGAGLLEELSSDIERNYRFAIDESTLRNKVTRLHFYLDKYPQEFAVEYGPDSNFVIPSSILTQGDNKTDSEWEEFEKVQKKLNQNFTRVNELESGNKKIDESLRVIGVGTSLSKALISEGEVSAYIYPSGEKDSAFIAIADDYDMVVITTEAFTNTIEVGWEKIPQTDEDLIERQLALARDLFAKWLEN